jgi:hypothetical protein
MEKRWIIALTATLGLALSLGANAAPDFSGSWVVNNDRGENLPMGGRVKESVTITQTPEKVVMNITASFMGTTMERTVTYDLSGKPVENSGPMGGKAETVAKWEGDQLVVTWTSEGALPGSRVVKTESRSLSADGREMTVRTAQANKPDMVVIYEKK